MQSKDHQIEENVEIILFAMENINKIAEDLEIQIEELEQISTDLILKCAVSKKDSYVLDIEQAIKKLKKIKKGLGYISRCLNKNVPKC